METIVNVPFSFRMDEGVRAKLKQQAKQCDRSESYIANLAIKSYLEANTAKQKAIDEAVSRAQNGSFVSEEDMNLWVDSWGSPSELSPPKTKKCARVKTQI